MLRERNSRSTRRKTQVNRTWTGEGLCKPKGKPRMRRNRNWFNDENVLLCVSNGTTKHYKKQVAWERVPMLQKNQSLLENWPRTRQTRWRERTGARKHRGQSPVAIGGAARNNPEPVSVCAVARIWGLFLSGGACGISLVTQEPSVVENEVKWAPYTAGWI